MSLLIGVDIGGTNTVIGMLDTDARVLARDKVSTASLGGGGELPVRLAERIVTLVTTNGRALSEVAAVGVGTPGIVDPRRGISVFSVNLGYRDFPMAERISQAVGKPVFVDNDVRMYALGEALRGAGKSHASVLCLTVGTGLAAASVVNGNLHYGGNFAAGEIGHTPVPGIRRRCACGLYGCAEIYVSATGMIRQAQEALSSGKPSLLASIRNEGRELTAADISGAHDLGDTLARDIFRRTVGWLAKSLATAVPLLDPDAVIVGGGVARSGDRLLGPLREELGRRLHPLYRERLTITTAELGDDAGLVGNALYARKQIGGFQG